MKTINELPKFPIKGELRIWVIDSATGNKNLVSINNALVNNAREIVAKALGGQLDSGLDYIKVYKAGVLLATNTSPVVITFPATYEVQFNARFDEASFNDTLDELRLGHTTLGLFSAVTGLSINKTNLLQIEVEWKLTINIL